MPSHSLPTRDKVLIDLLDKSTNVTKALSRGLRNGLDFYGTIKENTSEEIVRAIKEFEEVAAELSRQLPRPPAVYMTKKVLEWFDDSPESHKEEFVTTAFENLAVFMSSTGQTIIDHFNLWSYPWKPEIRDGVDMSPHHPENLAMQVIQNVWRAKQDA